MWDNQLPMIFRLYWVREARIIIGGGAMNPIHGEDTLTKFNY
jgi:hypothetical protein